MKIPSPKKEESKHKIDINKTYPNLLTCGTLLEHATYAKKIKVGTNINFDYKSKTEVRKNHLQASKELVDETTALQSIKDGKWHIMSKDYTDTEQKIIAYQNDKQIVLTFGTCIFRTKKGTAGSGIKNTKDCKLATDYPTKKMELTFGRKTQPESKHDIYFKTAVKLAQFAIDNECNLTIVAAQETCILAKYASLAIAKSGIKADTRIMLFDNCGIMMEAHHQTIVINNRNNGITNNLYSNSFSVEGDKVFQHEDLNKSVTSILKKLNPKTGYFTDQFKIATDIPATIATNTDKKPSNVAKFGFWFVETTFAVIGLGAIATGVGAPIALACGIGAIVVSKILKPKYNSDTKQTIRDCVKALIVKALITSQDESTIVSYEQYQKQSKEKVTKSYTVLHDLEFRDDKCISKIFIPRNKIHHMWELLSSKKIIASVLKDTFHENPRIEKLLLLIKAQYEFRIEKNNEQQTFFIIKSTDDAQDIFQIEAALFKLLNTYNEVEILKELSSKVNFQSNFREELMNITQQIAEANEVLSNKIEAIKTAQNAIRLLEKQEQDGNKESLKQIKAQKNIIAIQYHKIKKYCETATLLLIKTKYKFNVVENNEQQKFFTIKSIDDAQDIFQIEAALFKLLNTYNEVEILKELSSKVNFQSNFREELMNITQQIAEANEVLSNQIEAIKTAQNAIRLLEKQEQDGNKESFKQIKAQKNIIAIQYHKIKKYCETAKIDFVILDRKITDQLELGLIAYRVQALEKELQDTRKQLEKAKKAITDNKNQSSDNKNQISNLTLKVTTLEKQLAELKTEPIKLKNSISDIDLNDNFVGRTDEQQIIQKLLEDDNTKVIAVTGVGGIGKSTLCAEVAGFLATPLTQRQSGRLTSDKLNSISTDLNESEWCAHTFDARSEEDLRKGLASLGRTILSEQALTNISKTYSKPQEIQKQIIIESSSALEKHLKENGKQFLFIFDNVNDIADIEQYLNYAGKNVKILINSRNSIIHEDITNLSEVSESLAKGLSQAETEMYLNNTLESYVKDNKVTQSDLNEVIKIIGSKEGNCSPYFVNMIVACMSGQKEQYSSIKGGSYNSLKTVLRGLKKGEFDKVITDYYFQTIAPDIQKILAHLSYIDPHNINIKIVQSLEDIISPTSDSDSGSDVDLPLSTNNILYTLAKCNSLIYKISHDEYGMHNLFQENIKQYVQRANKRLKLQKKIIKSQPESKDNTIDDGIFVLKPQQIISNLTKILNDSIKDDDINDSNWSEVLKYTSHAKSVLDEINTESYSELLNDESWLKDHSEFVHNVAMLNHKIGQHSYFYSRQDHISLDYYNNALLYIAQLNYPEEHIQIMRRLTDAYTRIGGDRNIQQALALHKKIAEKALSHYETESHIEVLKSTFGIADISYRERIDKAQKWKKQVDSTFNIIEDNYKQNKATNLDLLTAYKCYIIFYRDAVGADIEQNEFLKSKINDANAFADNLSQQNKINALEYDQAKLIINWGKHDSVTKNDNMQIIQHVQKLIQYQNKMQYSNLIEYTNEIIKKFDDQDKKNFVLFKAVYSTCCAAYLVQKDIENAKIFALKYLEICNTHHNKKDHQDTIQALQLCQDVTSDNNYALQANAMKNRLDDANNIESKTLSLDGKLAIELSTFEKLKQFFDDIPDRKVILSLQNLSELYRLKFTTQGNNPQYISNSEKYIKDAISLLTKSTKSLQKESTLVFETCTKLYKIYDLLSKKIPQIYFKEQKLAFVELMLEMHEQNNILLDNDSKFTNPDLEKYQTDLLYQCVNHYINITQSAMYITEDVMNHQIDILSKTIAYYSQQFNGYKDLNDSNHAKSCAIELLKLYKIMSQDIQSMITYYIQDNNPDIRTALTTQLRKIISEKNTISRYLKDNGCNLKDIKIIEQSPLILTKLQNHSKIDTTATEDTANDIGDNKAIDNAIEEKQQIAETASQEPASIENLIGGSANDNNADPTNTASLSGESTENADHG